jgi:two-component system CheB/CheR fusion protein
MDAEPGPIASTGVDGPTSPLFAHLGDLVEVCSDGMIRLDVAGRVLAWNRAAGRILGHAATQVHHKTFAGALAEPGPWPQLFARAKAGERVEALRVEVLRAPGRPWPVLLSLVFLRDERGHLVECIAVLRDVGEQEFAQQTLAESARRVHRAEALTLTGTFVVDAQDRSAQWSDGMYRIHGKDPEHFAVTLASHLGLVVEQDREQVADAFELALAGETPVGVDHRVLGPGGTPTWVFLAVEPRFDAHGQIVGASGVCQDISGRIASTAALHEALEREQSVSEELRRVDALKDDFLATVSHELRTPLTSIAGFAALLEEQAPEHQRLVEPIARNAQQMHRLIQRLLDQAALESGRVILEAKPLALADAIRSTLSRASELLADTPVLVDVDESVVVVMDVDGFAHIVDNLVGNAIKHAPGASIMIRAQVNGDTVTVSVSDDGPGIAAEHQEHLFGRFFQVPGTERAARGSGFGLAIVRRYVELHHGTVWCESAPGSGTTFFFTAPAGSDRTS